MNFTRCYVTTFLTIYNSMYILYKFTRFYVTTFLTIYNFMSFYIRNLQDVMLQHF